MTLTNEGFKRKRYEDFLEELEQQARELFGANVNLGDNSPLGQWIKLIAFQSSESNEAMEDLYNSDYADTATGISLDYVGKRIGISRVGAERSKVTLTLAAEAGTTIPTGFIAQNDDGVEFYVQTGGTEAGGTITLEATAMIPGIIGNVPAGTITTINTPMAGVNSVTNAQAAKGGREKETDAEFRERYYRSLAKGGGASIPSIQATLLELPGVIDAIVDENDAMITSIDGIPAKSVAPFVYGGDDQEIAQAIFEQKAGGIQSFGSVTKEITDLKNKVHTIGFSRPTVVDVNVRITLTKNGDYPDDGDAQVKNKVIEYIGGTNSQAVEYGGQGLGGGVTHYKVIAAIATVPGINDVVVELSTDGGIIYNEENIVIDGKSVAKTDDLKVIIQ